MQKLHIMYKEMSIYILLSPLIKKSNSSICIAYLSFLYLETKHKSVRIVPLFSPTSFLYSYEADFIQSLLSTGKKHLASRFNLTYRYIDDVLSINKPEFENYLGQMYPAELEIKDTTESTTSASYLDLLLSIGRDGQLHTSIYDKRDDFSFHITNFPFLSSNIPSSPV